MVKVRDIIDRYTELKSLRKPWEALWQDVADYALPSRSFLDNETKGQEGQRPSATIYDSFPVSALKMLAEGMQGYLVSPAIRWFKLKMKDSETQKLPFVMDWLESVENHLLYSTFNKSNFYPAVSEFFLDGGGIGTAIMYLEDDIARDKINFSTRHIKECFLSENRHGAIDTVYRVFWLTARQAIQMFPKGLPEDIIRDSTENPFTYYKFLHAVFPRKDRDYDKIDSKNKKYASYYISIDKEKEITESGYDYFPYVCWRWRTNSDETYGRSDCTDSIPDILRLNQMAKSQLKAIQMAVEPPYNIPVEMKGLVKLIPNGRNYYTDPTKQINPIKMGSNYPIGEDVLEKTRTGIAENLRTDFFLMLSRMDRQMTAREVIERQGEKAAVLGAIVGRLNTDFLYPLIETVFQVEHRAGRLPYPPESLIKYQAMTGQKQTLDIEFIGPLAQAQKKYHQSQGVMQSMEAFLPLLQVKPEILDNVDMDEVTRQLMDAYGMPQKAVRELDEIKKIREARAQQEQQQMAMMQQQQAMEVYNKGLKAPEPNSPAEHLNNQMNEIAAYQSQGTGGGR